jgi:septum formation protein
MKNIFISYRRSDAESDARSIKLGLEKITNNLIFFDRSSIEPGVSWEESIRFSLARSDTVLVVIGPNWLRVQNEQGRRRIDDPDDWVRKEIQFSLENDKKIIPILVRGAKALEESSLPDAIKKLTSIQAISLNNDHWESDLKEIAAKAMIKQLTTPTIIFSSESPRRKELLKQIGWQEGENYLMTRASVSLTPNAPKNRQTGKYELNEVIDHVEKTVREKINYVVSHRVTLQEKYSGRDIIDSKSILVGIDTLVFCDGKILDRPLMQSLETAGPAVIMQARQRAKEMLLSESGKTIHIITGIALALWNNHLSPKIIHVETTAQLRNFTKDEIDSYIKYAEPFDKAGAFGIQEKGVSLFESINGSYSNIVGLPLRDFYSFLVAEYGESFALPPLKSPMQTTNTIFDENNILKEEFTLPGLSVFCVGDINYDFIFDDLPEGFFNTIHGPAIKSEGRIRRQIGGTAVNFARGAQRAGFTDCYVVGVVGRDPLGLEIVDRLSLEKIKQLITIEAGEDTSIAIILRDKDKKDTSLTLTDSRQYLSKKDVMTASGLIPGFDVFYCSGYNLIDPNRKTSTLTMMKVAKEHGSLILLDVVWEMSKKLSYMELEQHLREKPTDKILDVIVSELPEIFRWYEIQEDPEGQLATWEKNREKIIDKLRRDYSVAILRTNNYTHEITISPTQTYGPDNTDYNDIESHEKVGYGDFRTAKQIYKYLSPRILLASKSPQRLELLSQIVSLDKIEISVSKVNEKTIPHESPHKRVSRLALEKAENVFYSGNFSDSIEIIIGADTEIVVKNENTQEWQLVGHPKSRGDAEKDLRELSGKSHNAITGIAILGEDPNEKGKIKKFFDYIETKVEFAKLSEEEIQRYIATNESIDRAGAYAIQGLGTMLVKKIEGSYSNVVGLPLERLSEILDKEFNKPIWIFDKVSQWVFSKPIKELPVNE